jgi:RimJ/RimL family protein N-acetyltransferase
MQLKTDRLIIRNATLDDAPFFYELMNSPSWIEHIGDRGIDSLEASRIYIQDNLIKCYETIGFGMYVACLQSTPIGLCGLVKRDYLELPDLGFALLDTHARKGYIQEAGTAILQFAFQKLGLKKILAITSEANSASQMTLQNLGFESEGTIESPEGLQLLLFEKSEK